MGNIHARQRPSFALPGRAADIDACRRKLDALQVTCYKRQPALHPDSPGFLRVDPVKSEVADCCDWVGSRGPSPIHRLWYVADSAGRVSQLGPADIGADGKPSRIYNVLGPELTVPRGEAFSCSGLGELRPGEQHNEPTLAVLVEGERGRLVVTCRLGRLYSNPLGELHFFPCGGSLTEPHTVRAAQVAPLVTMSYGMRNVCLHTGAAPGYSPPVGLQAAHGRTAKGRADVREEAQEAASSCASHAAVLSSAVLGALRVIESGTAEQQRTKLDEVRRELGHARRLATQDCVTRVNAFLQKAEPAVCLAEANSALVQEGLPPIPQGATAAEDLAHMRRMSQELASRHSTSRAVGVLAKCAHVGGGAPPRHGRTDLDSACGQIAGASRALAAVHGATPGQRELAVKALQASLQAVPVDTPRLADCRAAADRYVDLAAHERCLGLIGGKPGGDEGAAAVEFLHEVESGGRDAGCEEYECLKKIDASHRTNTALRALKASATLRAGKPLLAAVRGACAKDHRRLLASAEAHMDGDPQWSALLHEAQNSGPEECAEAVEKYVVGVDSTRVNAVKECQAPPVGTRPQRPQRRRAKLGEWGLGGAKATAGGVAFVAGDVGAAAADRAAAGVSPLPTARDPEGTRSWKRLYNQKYAEAITAAKKKIRPGRTDYHAVELSGEQLAEAKKAAQSQARDAIAAARQPPSSSATSAESA